MAGSPQWKRVLLSGSNFEVNQLTSSEDLGNVGSSGTYPVVFSDPVTRGWKQTSSIYLDAGTSLKQLHISDSFTLNSPDRPISASQVGSIIPVDTHISSSMLFLHNTTGRFEYTSSFNIEPVLTFVGSQSADANHQIRSGSDLFGPNPAETAIFPIPGSSIGFTGSYEHSPFNYIEWNNGDFIDWRKSMPVGSGITCSFSIPYVYNGAIQTQGANVTLRRWVPGEYADPGFYQTQETIGFAIATLHPEGGVAAMFSGSLTGSFKVDSAENDPILEGERWQLIIAGHENFSAGFSTSHSNIGSASAAQAPMKFELHGPTNIQSLGATILLNGGVTSSFVGDVFGGYSGSLYGVTLNEIPSTKGLFRNKGTLLIANGSAVNPFLGANQTTASVRLAGMGNTGTMGENKSGLTFGGINETSINAGEHLPGSPLRIAGGLPGSGLQFNTVGYSDQESIQIKLENFRGLDLEFESVSDTMQSLVVSGGLLADALTATGFGSGSAGGSASIDLWTVGGGNRSGLTLEEGTGIEAGKLMLSSSLAGYGLLFPSDNVNDRSSMSIDTSVIVTSSGEMTLAVATSPQTLAVTNTGTPTQTSTTPSYGFDADDGTVANVGKMDFLDREIDKAIEISGSVLVKGDLKILSSSNVTSIHAETFQTTDQFIRLNSGSSASEPFSFDNGGLIVQTSVTNSQASGSALFFDDGAIPTQTIGGQTFADIGWGVTQPNKIPWDAHNISGSFDKGASPTSIIDNDYAVLISTVKIGADNSSLAANPSRPDAVSATNQPFYDSAALGSLGSFYIDTGSTGAGNESNVYIYGIFDD